jgi:hypothetical protein
MTQGVCERAYDTNGVHDGRNEGVAGATPDPVPGLDFDDEIVFMAGDAGNLYTGTDYPAGWEAVQQVALLDPLDATAQRFVYVVQLSEVPLEQPAGYVNYQRHADADQWIDRHFFTPDDPQKLGSSNTGYGSNLSGTVCVSSLADYHGDDAACVQDQQSGQFVCPSQDRFPRDGVTVTTANYRWEASGRWMVRDLRVRGQQAEDDWESRPDLIDRWKGRAFQQSPDSAISLVGFEDEQVNWEANSILIGERCGPVRCMRAIWGADSGTNTTKTETFYRDAITYRYRVRVHPIPTDGLYTAWDYNRDVMLAGSEENVEPGRYYTMLRPQGVPIDGINDDIGQVDGVADFPAFFDVPDPTFNLIAGIYNWEQVSGKGDAGSLVYIFEINGAASVGNPLIATYYRDDACLDDGTGDDPVQRPWPGETSTDARVTAGYEAVNGGVPYAQLDCSQRQGAYGAHGVHYLFTHDTDNAFSPLPVTEVDGQQWQFMVPTDYPQNIAEPYANTVRVKLVPIVAPVTLPGLPDQ